MMEGHGGLRDLADDPGLFDPGRHRLHHRHTGRGLCHAGNLKGFIYRLEGYWWIFVLAAVITFAVSLLSILWQTLKAAKTNPAVELKKE